MARHNWIKSRSIVRRITTLGKLMCFNKRVEFLEESSRFLRAKPIIVSTVTMLYRVADKSRLPNNSYQNQSISRQDVAVRCRRPELVLAVTTTNTWRQLSVWSILNVVRSELDFCFLASYCRDHTDTVPWLLYCSRPDFNF